MALLNFPENPVDGQLFPNPCPAGVTQYRWDSSVGIWRIVGVATGVAPGTYGSATVVGKFTVDVAGAITDAENVQIQSASIDQPGIVQLTNSTTSIDETKALTARGGKDLQDQIGNLANCIVPNHVNVVDALNDLQNQSFKLQSDALVWCGYYNAQEGDISYVSITGQRLGYQIGQELPVSNFRNGGDFFIVNVSGNPYLAGDFNAPNEFIPVGNWVVSEAARWSNVDARGGPVRASDVLFSPTGPLTATNVQNAIYQITQLFRTGIGGATISDKKPENPYPGQLWWDDDDGIFYIYYTDINSSQWVELGGGGSQGLGGGGSGTVYEIRTGVGLLGGPITTEGTISLQPSFVNSTDFAKSNIGGVIPHKGFVYSNSTGVLDLQISGDATGKDPYTAFSQEGANILNAKIDALSGGNVLAGTYNAKLGQVVYATPAGAAKGFIPGKNLPAPTAAINNYYVIVTIGGGQGPIGPQVSGPGDWYICQADEVPAIWFLIDYEGVGSQAVNVAVTPIPGIEQASNVQRALELLELQAQDRIEFAEATTDGLQIKVSSPRTSSYDGTTLSVGLDYASVQDRGIVQLTNDYRGNSETLAITQRAANEINAKIDAVSGGNVLAGTYNSNTGLVVSVSPSGAAAGFVVGQQAPAAANVPDNFYLIVVVTGGYGPPGAPIPPAGVQSGDWFIVEKQPDQSAAWVTIDYENRTVDATQVSLSPIPGLTATNVQQGLTQIQSEIDQTLTGLSSSNNGITINSNVILPTVGKTAQLTLNPATSTDIGGVFVAPNLGLGLTASGGLSLLPPTATTLGGVKAGANITIAADGTISSTGGGGGGNGYVVLLDNIASQFNGSRTAFVLQYGGANLPSTTTIAQLFIFVGGIEQVTNVAFSWNAATSTITFTSPPAAGLTFNGRAVLSVSNPTQAEIRLVDSISTQFNGSQTTFVLKSGGANLPASVTESELFIDIGGVTQPPQVGFTYNSASSTITFTFAPPAGVTFSGRAIVALPTLTSGGSGTVTSITFSSPLTGGTITESGTVGIQNASATQSGAMTAAYAAKLESIPNNIPSTIPSNIGTNASGNRTVSTSAPSGGNDGDIWYVV